ncbi:cytochrome c [Roseomonas sp. E05]|uniref:c-type cytochrome n=1 Tax=Roseomonas sp. E05 TaxID=3046310 RepID=UPI0024B8EBFC|nr:cytochrome c [Roseomonas sp. E05]MDJ0386503.1 cytochrome c [Roseomonas sp. E05]
MRMKQVSLALVLLGATGLAGLAPSGSARAQGDVIAQRQAGLKRMSGNLETIKKTLEAKGELSIVAERSQDMVAFFQGFPALFPPGSDKGDTHARPEVWSNRAGFEAAATRMVAAATKLNQVATAGDAGATATAFREAGGTCGACHREFRAR